jgi:hypothetical protein
MQKSLAAAMAALTFGGAVAATAVPAEARPHYNGYYDYRHHSGNGAGTAIAAGIAGLALGAALSSSSHGNSYARGGYAYDRGYYPRGYVYERPYRVCESERWVYDPYIGRRVPIIERYAC